MTCPSGSIEKNSATATATREESVTPPSLHATPVVLLATEGTILAHVGRALAIARVLEQAGLNVRFAASGPHAWRLERKGRPVEPLRTRPRHELLSRLKRGGSAFDYATLRTYAADEIRLLEKLRPDVVIGDFRPSLAISAEVTHVPYVCVTNAVWTPYYRFTPDPPASWWPTRIFGKGLLRRLAPLLRRPVFRHYAAPFNRLRRDFALAPKDDIRDCMCSDRCTLIADVPELFPCDGLPSGYRYIGPVLWEPDVPKPCWIEELKPDLPTVYVTMGSTGVVGEIGAIARALAAQGFQVAATTGNADTLRDPPAGCHAAPYAPGGELCDRADVVVCHGGNGTIYQALSRGRPIVGVPRFHDQEFQMQRIEACGLGVTVFPGRDLPRRICAAVRKVLEEPAYARRAEGFRRLISRSDYARVVPETVALAAQARTRRER